MDIKSVSQVALPTKIESCKITSFNSADDPNKQPDFERYQKVIMSKSASISASALPPQAITKIMNGPSNDQMSSEGVTIANDKSLEEEDSVPVFVKPSISLSSQVTQISTDSLQQTVASPSDKKNSQVSVNDSLGTPGQCRSVKTSNSFITNHVYKDSLLTGSFTMPQSSKPGIPILSLSKTQTRVKPVLVVSSSSCVKPVLVASSSSTNPKSNISIPSNFRSTALGGTNYKQLTSDTTDCSRRISRFTCTLPLASSATSLPIGLSDESSGFVPATTYLKPKVLTLKASDQTNTKYILLINSESSTIHPKGTSATTPSDIVVNTGQPQKNHAKTTADFALDSSDTFCKQETQSAIKSLLQTKCKINNVGLNTLDSSISVMTDRNVIESRTSECCEPAMVAIPFIDDYSDLDPKTLNSDTFSKKTEPSVLHATQDNQRSAYEETATESTAINCCRGISQLTCTLPSTSSSFHMRLSDQSSSFGAKTILDQTTKRDYVQKKTQVTDANMIFPEHSAATVTSYLRNKSTIVSLLNKPTIVIKPAKDQLIKQNASVKLCEDTNRENPGYSCTASALSAPQQEKVIGKKEKILTEPFSVNNNPANVHFEPMHSSLNSMDCQSYVTKQSQLLQSSKPVANVPHPLNSQNTYFLIPDLPTANPVSCPSLAGQVNPPAPVGSKLQHPDFYVVTLNNKADGVPRNVIIPHPATFPANNKSDVCLTNSNTVASNPPLTLKDPTNSNSRPLPSTYLPLEQLIGTPSGHSFKFNQTPLKGNLQKLKGSDQTRTRHIPIIKPASNTVIPIGTSTIITSDDEETDSDIEMETKHIPLIKPASNTVVPISTSAITSDDEETDSDIEMNNSEEQDISLLNELLMRADTNRHKECVTKEPSVPELEYSFVRTKKSNTKQRFSENPVGENQNISEVVDTSAQHVVSRAVNSLIQVNENFANDENECFGIRIESVYSLNGSTNSEILNETSETEQRNYNIRESSEWKNAVQPCFVVLERLCTSNTSETPKCSEHCRKRTLNYLCNLHLLPCNNHPNVSTLIKPKMITIGQEVSDKKSTTKSSHHYCYSKPETCSQNVSTLVCSMKKEPSVPVEPPISRAISKLNFIPNEMSSTTDSFQGSRIMNKEKLSPLQGISKEITSSKEADMNLSPESPTFLKLLKQLRTEVTIKRINMTCKKFSRQKKEMRKRLSQFKIKNKSHSGMLHNSNSLAGRKRNKNLQNFPITPPGSFTVFKTTGDANLTSKTATSLPSSSCLTSQLPNLPAEKINAALKSLTSYLSATGKKVTEGNAQYFMLKIENQIVLVKMNEATNPVQHPNPVKPHKSNLIVKLPVKPHKSNLTVKLPLFPNKMKVNPHASTRQPETGIGKCSQDIIKNKQLDSSSPDSSHTKRTAYPKSISLLNPVIPLQSHSSAINSDSSDRQLVSPFTLCRNSESHISNNETSYDTRSALSHLLPNSTMLPERKTKMCTLTEKERKAKRQKLEAKYPLPPGVVIKSEPDGSQYEQSWTMPANLQIPKTSVCLPASTNKVPQCLSTTTCSLNINERPFKTGQRNKVIQQKGATPQKPGLSEQCHKDFVLLGHQTTELDQHISESFSNMDDDQYESDDPPPLIDETLRQQKKSQRSDDNESSDSIEEMPPILQPMFTSTSSLLPVIDTDDLSPSHIFLRRSSQPEIQDSKKSKSTMFIKDNHREANLSRSGLSLHSKPSSSSTDIGFAQSSTSASTSLTALSNVAGPSKGIGQSVFKNPTIQRLKELLKKKEMELENIRNAKSQQKTFDLSAV